jgi:hypothetical protein
MKPQHVRLMDVFLLGPFMVWAGFQLKHPAAKIAMVTSGVGTVLYNGNNYLRARRTKANVEKTIEEHRFRQLLKR